MLKETLFSSGHNKFYNAVFSDEEWSAPTMIDPVEIIERIASFDLEGRIIKSVKSVGFCYSHTCEGIEDSAYNALDYLEEKDRRERSNYDNIPPHLPFQRCVYIDEPFLIRFEDENVFEIEAPREPEFRLSMNCIPWEIGAGTNQPNLTADCLFGPCIGRKITTAEVETYFTDKDPLLDEFFDEDHSKIEVVSKIVLHLDDGNRFAFEGVIDFMKVSYEDPAGEILQIPFCELKPSLSNWEDLEQQ